MKRMGVQIIYSESVGVKSLTKTRENVPLSEASLAVPGSLHHRDSRVLKDQEVVRRSQTMDPNASYDDAAAGAVVERAADLGEDVVVARALSLLSCVFTTPIAVTGK